jgi:uncharacterized caspase-like protein
MTLLAGNVPPGRPFPSRDEFPTAAEMRRYVRGLPFSNVLKSEALALQRNSFALVIGIDAYANGWPRLSNAVADAMAVGEELKRQGFDVTLATDLGSTALENVIESFVYERGRVEDARLLIWYAGHGHTIDGEAYLVPADAPAASTDWEFRRSALSMRDFGKYMREARSRHVLAIFDSCFSGGVFETTRAIHPPAITRATSLPVRQLISSGQAEQVVSDDGTFRRLFIDALRGDEARADANDTAIHRAENRADFLWRCDRRRPSLPGSPRN